MSELFQQIAHHGGWWMLIMSVFCPLIMILWPLSRTLKLCTTPSDYTEYSQANPPCSCGSGLLSTQHYNRCRRLLRLSCEVCKHA
jgi:hypothetical protein